MTGTGTLRGERRPLAGVSMYGCMHVCTYACNDLPTSQPDSQPASQPARPSRPASQPASQPDPASQLARHHHYYLYYYILCMYVWICLYVCTLRQFWIICSERLSAWYFPPRAPRPPLGLVLAPCRVARSLLSTLRPLRPTWRPSSARAALDIPRHTVATRWGSPSPSTPA